MPRRNHRGDQLRRLIANEAARLIAEHGIRDYGLAKRKAALRLGVDERGSLPRNSEVEEALAENQRLFAGREHHDLVTRLRRTAQSAMQMLEDFQPRLSGPVLQGTAVETSVIELHLFSDPAEAVALTLLERRVPHELSERRLRITTDEYRVFPVYAFEHERSDIEATVFPVLGLRQAPVSPVDGRPMRRVDRDGVADLVALDYVPVA